MDQRQPCLFASPATFLARRFSYANCDQLFLQQPGELAVKADTAEAPDKDVSTSRKAKAEPVDQADWTWMEPKSLKMDAEFQQLIPLQSRGELLALEESIKAEGCRDPLTVWKGHNLVLDGHTRRELCMRHKKQVKVREVELADRKAAIEFILQIQQQRRNLTREAMSYFRGSEYNAVKQQHGGSRRGRRSRGQSDHLKKTGDLLADKYQVSEKTIRRDAIFAQAIDQIVAEYGDPEIRRQLLSPDVKLTQGTARVLLKMPAKERKAAVDQLLKDGELPRASKKAAAVAPRPKEVAQSIMSRLQKKGDKHARSVLEQMARMLGLEVSEKVDGK